MSELEQTKQSNLGIPIAIIIAAGLIAVAIYFSGNSTVPGTAQNALPPEQQTAEVSVEPINADDHVRGNPNASIVLVEYSDYDCPFCKNFHETLEQINAEYGPSGKVAWVYRHLPLPSLHPNAPKIAEAAECVAEQTGNEGFWTFSDLVFGERAVNELTDPSRISEFAERAGADVAKFETCLNDGTYTPKITDSIAEAVAANGGTAGLGTPFTLVFVGDEYVGPISGAQPYASVKQNIDTILNTIEGSAAAE